MMPTTHSIPAPLLDRPRWVVWLREERNGKLTKVPYIPRLSQRNKADTTDPSTWSTYGAAVTVAEMGGYDGVGFVLIEEDEIVFIDLDKCRNPETGEIEPWALAIVAQINSYTEISPSGTGLHIIAHATLPPEGRRKGAIEMYCEERYATFTSNHLPGTPLTIEHRHAEVLTLHAHVFGDSHPPEGQQPEQAPADGAQNGRTHLSDEEIIRIASHAANGDKFQALWNGGSTGYESPSEADLALAGMLVFYTQDPTQLERLMRRSGRNRGKWDANRSYLQRTIRKALSGQTEHYAAGAASSDGFAQVGDDNEHTYESTGNSRFSRFHNTENRESERARLFKLTSLDDLLAEPELDVEYVVGEMLPASGLSLLAAKPKVGKSTLARNVSIAVAMGVPFLGRDTKQGKVVYLALEEKRSEVAKHFRCMEANRAPIFIHVGSAPDEAMGALAFAIDEHEPVLAIVDPILKLVRLKDANDYAQVSRAFEPVIDLARNSGCHILCVHHLGKGERTGGDAILGSTALFGAVDTALIMKRNNEGVRTVYTIQRYGADLSETVVSLDSDTGLVSAAGELSAVQLQRAKDTVLEAVGKETLTEPDIRDRVGGNQTLTAKAIRGLVEEGQLLRSGAGKRNDPYLYWASAIANDLPETSPES